MTDTRGADQCFPRITNKPTKGTCQGNTGIQLNDQMSRQYGQENDPPLPDWRKQKGGEQNSIRRPESCQGVVDWSEQKSDLRASIVTDCYQQCDCNLAQKSSRRSYNDIVRCIGWDAGVGRTFREGKP